MSCNTENTVILKVCVLGCIRKVMIYECYLTKTFTNIYTSVFTINFL